MNDVHYVAFDPGLTSGYACFDEKGDAIKMGQFKITALTETLNFLITPELKGVICEDYRNHGWMQQKKWSRNETSKIIGKIELMCELRSVPCHLQSNTVKAIGYRWAGLKEAPSNHDISHQYDAVAHGVFWLQQNGVREVGRVLKSNDESV
jgi:hypothetical protein